MNSKELDVEKTLIAKQEKAANWGFSFNATKTIGTRNAPNGWMEVWRSEDPDEISLYKDSNIDRSADEFFHIDWSLHNISE